MAENSTSSQLKRIAQEIRGCRYRGSEPIEHARYIVTLVEEALDIPDAFPGFDCLRNEIEQLRHNCRSDWRLCALQVIAIVFDPGYKPSSNFLQYGFTGDWDNIDKIADAIEREADGIAKDEAAKREAAGRRLPLHVSGLESSANSAVVPEAPLPDGPLPPNGFRWGGKLYSPIAKRPFLALTLAWPNDGRCLHKDDFADQLGERTDTLGDYAMQSIRGQLQAFFRLNELPYRATVSGLYLTIQDAPPKPADSKPKSKTKRRRAR